jgi:ubiquinol-cytochrome c reductase iron-sulfur subunit
MSQDNVNNGRRKFLIGATSAVGAVGAGFAAVPFVGSWLPNEKAKAAGAPVTQDISKLKSGELAVITWRGKGVYLVKRTPEMLGHLRSESVLSRLKDADSAVVEQQPVYVNAETRSIKEDLLVLEGVCTHLGCAPKFVPEVKPQGYDAEWKGGFFCPCHGSRFDLAGRVFNGSPAPTNLIVPPHSFDGNILTVGVDMEVS